eukprot:1147539-Pelagomonas_calceolata.AAC.1
MLAALRAALCCVNGNMLATFFESDFLLCESLALLPYCSLGLYEACRGRLRCPGVYEACGGRLRWVRLGFWGCERWPKCGYRYWPPPAVPYPQLSLDVISAHDFRVRVEAVQSSRPF